METEGSHDVETEGSQEVEMNGSKEVETKGLDHLSCFLRTLLSCTHYHVLIFFDEMGGSVET